MIRVAVIDIGTNSTRLLVADVQEPGIIVPVYTDLKTTRLGQGVGGKLLLPEAVSRAVEAITDMRAQAMGQSASVVVAAATSAVRDALNRDWFLDEVYHKTKLRVRVLEGEEEAYLSYLGVTAGFGGDAEGALIVDIGGGSTEFAWFRGGRVVCRSVNAGAVRITEGGHDREAICGILREAIDEVKRDRPREIIGVGGTVTTLAAMDMKLEVYSRDLCGCPPPAGGTDQRRPGRQKEDARPSAGQGRHNNGRGANTAGGYGRPGVRPGPGFRGRFNVRPGIGGDKPVETKIARHY